MANQRILNLWTTSRNCLAKETYWSFVAITSGYCFVSSHLLSQMHAMKESNYYFLCSSKHCTIHHFWQNCFSFLCFKSFFEIEKWPDLKLFRRKRHLILVSHESTSLVEASGFLLEQEKRVLRVLSKNIYYSFPTQHLKRFVSCLQLGMI